MPIDQPSRDETADADASLRGDREPTVEKLEELLVHGGAGVVATDLDGVITHWSIGAQRLYGWSAAEAIGQPVLELLIAPDDRLMAAANIETIRETGNWQGQFDIRHKDGAVICAFTRGTLIKDDAGRPVGLLALSMDASG